MSSPSVKVAVDGHGRGQVWLDGVQLDHVVSLSIYVDAGQANRVQIIQEFSPAKVDVVAEGAAAMAHAG